MPPVSIIVPIYNSEDTIGDCIRSIVDQSFADIEIILVNDGSIDGSQQICDEYAQKDARIRVFFQENKGRSFMLPSRWMRKLSTSIGSVIRNI